MSRFPPPSALTTRSAVTWSLAALRYFEEVCRTGDRTQLRAASRIGYALHNLPGMLQRKQNGERSLPAFYGPSSVCSPDPEVTRLTKEFFAQDAPDVAVAPGRRLPEPLLDALFEAFQAFRLAFGERSVFATEEGWDERRASCAALTTVVRRHLERWITDGVCDHEALCADRDALVEHRKNP